MKCNEKKRKNTINWIYYLQIHRLIREKKVNKSFPKNVNSESEDLTSSLRLLNQSSALRSVDVNKDVNDG